jgi:uncharacterized protein
MDASRAGRETDSAVAASDIADHRRNTAACCGIAVMAKASLPGRAKTRLVPPLDYDDAAALNTAFLHDVFDNILLAASRAAPDASIAAYAAYGPPGSEDFFRSRFPDIDLIEAWFSDFGACLLHAIEQMFARGHQAAVVLNADSPTLPTALLNETAAALARPGDRAVLGPSSDGGYYLLGLKAAHRRLFEDIAWSTERVAEQTRERAREIGLELHVLPEWYDVDDVASLRRLHAEIFDGTAPMPQRARHSVALLSALWPAGVFGRRAKSRGRTAEARMPSGAAI